MRDIKKRSRRGEDGGGKRAKISKKESDGEIEKDRQEQSPREPAEPEEPADPVAIGDGPQEPDDLENKALVQQNLAIISALAKQNDASALENFVQNMEPGLLAEIVIFNMRYLPATPPISFQTPQKQQLLQQQQQQQQQVKVEPGVPSNGHTGTLTTTKAIKTKTAPTLAPIPIPVEEETRLRQDIQDRIINASTASTSSTSDCISVNLVARILEMAPAGDETEARLLKHLFVDWHKRRGHDIAVALLYKRFSKTVKGQKREKNTQTSAGALSDDEENSLIFKEYHSLLLHIISGLKESLPHNDRAIQKLLQEAPFVTISSVAFLSASCTGEWSTLMLSTLRDIAIEHPVVRKQAMEAILKAAISDEEDVRGKAVRLIANRLMPHEFLKAIILDFSRLSMKKAIQSTSEKKKDQIVDENDDPVAVSPQKESDADDNENDDDNDDDGSFTSAKGVSAGSTSVFPLFLALCTKSHSMLSELAEAYSASTPQQRQSVHVNLPGLIRAVGAESSDLQTIISSPPAGSEAFALQALHGAVDSLKQLKKDIPPELVEAAKQLHLRMNSDGRALVPVLSAMDVETAMKSLPKLVMLLQAQWKSALSKLLHILTPQKILIALHTLDAAAEGVSLKKVIEAISVCLASQQVFTSEVLALAVDAMVDFEPLPLLFMRTLIQCVQAHPSLAAFARGILGKLVKRQVWNMSPKVWQGFLHSLKQLAPGSFEVIQQLPVDKLDDVFKTAPEIVKSFSDFMSVPSRKLAVPKEFLVKIGLEA